MGAAQSAVQSGRALAVYVAGVADTDFSDTRTSPNGTDTPFRTQDPVRMQRSLDLRRAQYDAAGGPDNSTVVLVHVLDGHDGGGGGA